MTTQLSTVGNELFKDDFASTGRLNGSLWHFNKWQPRPYDGSYLGQTQMRQELPFAENGMARIRLDTYFTDQHNPVPGKHFLGSEAISNQAFSVANGGIAFEGVLRFQSTQGGMIAGFFSYQQFPDRTEREPHDEIDFEILTTNLSKVSTNVFVGATPGANKDFPASTPMIGSFADWHTYRMEWLPGMVRWFVDGILIRTETEHVPSKPQELHMNLWGVPGGPGGFGESKGDSLGPKVGDPTFKPSTNPNAAPYFLDVKSAKVWQLSTRLGDDNPNTIDGTAQGDGIEGRGGDDALNGLAGDDTLYGGGGNDTINGGEGNDTAVYRKARSNYDVTFANGVLTVTDRTGLDGTDTLTSTEFLNFKDALYEVVGGNVTSTPANVARIGETIWGNDKPPSNYPNQYVQQYYSVGSDGTLTPVSATNPIALAAAPEPPAPPDLVLYTDAYAILENRVLVGTSVLANDSSGLPVSVSLVRGPSHGTVDLESDGTFTYTPNAGFQGFDNFVYEATDASGQSGEALAFVNVTPVAGGASEALDLMNLSVAELVATMYVGFLGRGADLAGFLYWAREQEASNERSPGLSEALHEMANNFAASAEAKAIYPLLAHPATTSDDEIAAFLDSVYDNLFGRAVDAGGGVYWAGQIEQAIATGQALGSIVVSIISGAQDSGGNHDIAVLAGRAVVSLEYVDWQFEKGTTWGPENRAAASALIHSVTADPASLLMGMKQAADLVIADALG